MTGSWRTKRPPVRSAGRKRSRSFRGAFGRRHSNTALRKTAAVAVRAKTGGPPVRGDKARNRRPDGAGDVDADHVRPGGGGELAAGTRSVISHCHVTGFIAMPAPVAKTNASSSAVSTATLETTRPQPQAEERPVPDGANGDRLVRSPLRRRHHGSAWSGRLALDGGRMGCEVSTHDTHVDDTVKLQSEHLDRSALMSYSCHAALEDGAP